VVIQCNQDSYYQIDPSLIDLYLFRCLPQQNFLFTHYDGHEFEINSITCPKAKTWYVAIFHCKFASYLASLGCITMERPPLIHQDLQNIVSIPQATHLLGCHEFHFFLAIGKWISMVPSPAISVPIEFGTYIYLDHPPQPIVTRKHIGCLIGSSAKNFPI
jgi:hypothetical protein